MVDPEDSDWVDHAVRVGFVAYGIVAETSCQFLRELRFPGDVQAGRGEQVH